jgi:outer membrane protein OmpA-like peptidoglycan-associated protein
MRHDIRLTVLAAVAVVVTAGCVATQEWTQEQFGKREVEIDERFVKVETGAREQGERIDRVEVRIGQLDTGLAETRDLVRTALTQPSRPVAPRATAPATPTARRTLIGVVHVPFAFDRADLDVSAEAALLTVVRELRDHPYMTIDLEGTTDPVGKLDYNLRLSQRRMETVRRWLLQKGVDSTRIRGLTAKGPIGDVALKNNLKRRVEVKLMESPD